MNNTSILGRLALLGFMAVATPSAVIAQDAPADPPADAKNFGPRKKAQAAPAQQQGAPVKVVSTHGKWQIQCQEGKGADGKVAKSCGMIQGSKSDKNPNLGISVIVNKVKQQGKSVVFMRILAPIGVFLPTGIAVEIDGAALPNRMIYNRCFANICEAQGEASPESLKKFQKGTAATFYIYDRPGNGFPMKISLEGFGAGLTAMDKL